MPSLVTLTTDFEEREPVVASLKGVLHRGCRGVQVLDLSHQIPRGDVMETALFLAGAVPHFPDGTIHLVGVAPGPAPIVVATHGQYIVGPDNGAATILLDRFGTEGMWSIAVPDAADATGQTFFSRDVFAPAAARLAAGASPAELGEAIEQVTRLELPHPQKKGSSAIVGEIIHVDRFGNLLTNIHRSFVEDVHVKRVEVGRFPVGGLSTS